MGDQSDQPMIETDSLLILIDDCLWKILPHLTLVDFVNLADTCSRLRNIACEFSKLNHKKIAIEAISKYAEASNSISKKNFFKILSKIGEHILEVEVNEDQFSQFILNAIKEKCKSLKRVTVFANYNPELLQGFCNLKQLKVGLYVKKRDR